MSPSKLVMRKATEIGLLACLLLLAGIVHSDAPQEVQQGEELVVLTVENMT